MEKRSIPVSELPSGDILNITPYHFSGSAKGPEIYIQANLHGAETQGNLVIKSLINFFENNRPYGNVTLLPISNPISINQKSGHQTFGRFNPTTGTNWNRHYPDITKLPEDQTNFSLLDFVNKHKDLSWHEINSTFKKYLFNSYQFYYNYLKENYLLSDHLALALTHLKLLAHSDIVLDLHTGPKATQYLYTNDMQQDKAKDLNFPFNLVIPSVFAGALDEAAFMPWICLHQSLKKAGYNHLYNFESYTLELESEETISLLKGKTFASQILLYLAKRELIKRETVLNYYSDIQFPIENSQQVFTILANFRGYFSPTGGLIEYLVSPGDTVNRGKPLARIYNFKSSSDGNCHEVRALNRSLIINHSTLSSISKGTEIFQLCNL